MRTTEETDIPGLIAAVVMLAVSGWVFWESQAYTELAAAFPRTVALVMALASVVLIGRCLLGWERRSSPEAGSWLRRIALVVALVGWVALIPVLGFLLASLLGFLSCGLTARYGHWPMRRWIGFAALALAAVVLFYGVFSEILQVPFPQGWLL